MQARALWRLNRTNRCASGCKTLMDSVGGLLLLGFCKTQVGAFCLQISPKWFSHSFLMKREGNGRGGESNIVLAASMAGGTQWTVHDRSCRIYPACCFSHCSVTYAQHQLPACKLVFTFWQDVHVLCLSKRCMHPSSANDMASSKPG